MPDTELLPTPGNYEYGHRARLAQWDGQTWTGRYRFSSDVSRLSPWHHRPWAFLAHPWFWFVLTGMLLSSVSGFIFNNEQNLGLPIGVGVGITLAMVGIVLLVDRHLHFRELANMWMFVGLGVVSGGVAALLAWSIEGFAEPDLKIPLALDLWLSGVVEESAKNLVPFLLLLILPALFGNPRGGVLMVLISGSIFGIIEGIRYASSGTGENSHLVQGIVRPLVEISHPLWAAVAAALIFLAAHRAGRAFTLAGLVGWLMAVAQHSLHDGIATIGGEVHGTKNTVTDMNYTMKEVGTHALGLGIVSIVVVIIAYLILRHVLRELVPPTAIKNSARHWRPQLQLWGWSEKKKLEIETANAGALADQS